MTSMVRLDACPPVILLLNTVASVVRCLGRGAVISRVLAHVLQSLSQNHKSRTEPAGSGSARASSPSASTASSPPSSPTTTSGTSSPRTAGSSSPDRSPMPRGRGWSARRPSMPGAASCARVPERTALRGAANTRRRPASCVAGLASLEHLTVPLGQPRRGRTGEPETPQVHPERDDPGDGAGVVELAAGRLALGTVAVVPGIHGDAPARTVDPSSRRKCARRKCNRSSLPRDSIVRFLPGYPASGSPAWATHL